MSYISEMNNYNVNVSYTPFICAITTRISIEDLPVTYSLSKIVSECVRNVLWFCTKYAVL